VFSILFITADKNLRYQQNVQSRRIAILELPTNRWPKLIQLRQEVEAVLLGIRPGEYRFLESQ
jgi:hypothetical protein